jgi:hypothetical protein
MRSHAGTLNDLEEDGRVFEQTGEDGDEQSWRNGDGGSSPALRAIVLATVCRPLGIRC